MTPTINRFGKLDLNFVSITFGRLSWGNSDRHKPNLKYAVDWTSFSSSLKPWGHTLRTQPRGEGGGWSVIVGSISSSDVILFSNTDVILQSEGGGGQKRPKNCSHT